MKKIITVLFFAGFLTTASFAQSGHRQQTNTQSNGYGYQSHQGSGNHGELSSQNFRNDNGDYMDKQRNNRNNENEYGRNNDRYNQDEGNMGRNQYGYSRNNQWRFEDHSYRSWASRHHRMYRDDNRD